MVYTSRQRSTCWNRRRLTIKGIIAGIAIGFFAKKFHSLPIGILFGVIVGAYFGVSGSADAGRLLPRNRPARHDCRIDRRFRHTEVWNVTGNSQQLIVT